MSSRTTDTVPIELPEGGMKGSQEHKMANRRDHYLPQGYLRGFIDPDRKNRHRPLWHLDIPTGDWTEKSPKQVGYEDGFYDYAGEARELIHPDIAFAKLEREFPVVRDRLINTKFEGWAGELVPRPRDSVVKQGSRLFSSKSPLNWAGWRFIRRPQARVSLRREARSPIRRWPRHCRENRLMAISAWFSQLPCLGCNAR